ncbi:MAG TPA: flagellar basal body P-ring formation chaperone FlgA [Xanthobacteraceae bacterium]|nr:flagellar basal body P-ring formation chaperone FlgA [Xanthobacteraceae bacterium]
MTRTLIRTVFLLLALTGAAAAQSNRPALRASVIVDSSIVRIGDLVENAGPVADIPIFRAPDLGTTGAVSTDSVVEAIRPHQLIDIDTHGLAEVIVTRASRAIAPQEISDTITQALSQRFGLGEPRNLSLVFDLPVHTLQVEPTASGPLQVLALRYDPRSGRFDVTLDLPSSRLLQQSPARFTGSAMETVEAVTVNRPLERGAVLEASDLTVIRRPKAQANGFVDMNGAIGLAASHPLRPGQPLAAADLTRPQVVARNDTVTLIYEVPGLTLTLRGQAQDSGAVGDTIGVLNPQTKRVVQGVVSGPGRVTVAGTAMHLAENIPEVVQPSATAAPE